jgi:hypothetical protein
MLRTVMLAPVPAIHMASTIANPHLMRRVAFGTCNESVKDFTIGLDVFIYVTPSRDADPSRSLVRPGFVTWQGTLGAIVPAERSGRRNGKHPDPNVRPPSAEDTDTAFLMFWEVLNLHKLEGQAAIPLNGFSRPDGSSFSNGHPPGWPVLASLSGR